MSWRASWIWLPEQPQMDNLYVYARKEFDLREVPAQVMAKVSGSQLYQLFINGHYVGRGPNPADPSYYYYDSHDIARHLRPGRNVVALIGYCYSVTRQGIIGQNWGKAGLLCEFAAGSAIIATDASWRVLQAPPWDQAAEVNCTLYNDFKEVYDSRKELPGWMESGFDDSAWKAPMVIGTPPVAPWTRLLPREIPFLSGETLKAKEAFWESASVTYAWRKDWEVYHEQRLIEGIYHAPDKWTEITKTHADYAPAILLDFGTLVTGYLRIAVHDSGGGVIDCLYGENLNLVRVDRFILRGGEQVLAPYNRRTFRYLKLVFPDTPRRIDLDAVTLRMDTYPVETVGSFSCSDERLSRIYQVSNHTIKLSMLDHFVDCPWRERTIYGGDVYLENPFAYYAFGDPRLNRKTLRQMFALQFPEGALPPYGPYLGCDSFYPAWSAYLGLALIDDWNLTGDRAFIDELWPQLVKLCDWTLASSSRNSLPLIGSPAPGEGGDFPAYERARKGSYHAWEVFPFQVLLARAAALAHARGEESPARRWGACAATMADAIRTHLIDPTSGLAIPSPRPAGHVFQASDSTLLMWSGVSPAVQAQGVIANLFTPQAVAPIETPFNGYFMLEGLYAQGEDRRAEDFMRQYWGEMLVRGATTFWEFFSLTTRATSQFSRGGSACHGWSAAPSYALPAHVLGVQPLEPGFSRIRIHPQLGDLAWAAGTVPTPHGLVTVAWTRADSGFTLTCHLPRPAQVHLPVIHQHPRVVRVDGHVQPDSTQQGRPRIDLDAGDHRIEVVRR